MGSDRDILEFLRRYKWTILLALGGLVFGISVITYGLFKTIFIFICIAAGVWGGLQIDKNQANKRRNGDI